MTITFGRDICGELAIAQQREWLVTNGIGGYASGTIAGLATRGYHGLLVAALQPPLGRTVLVSHLDETLSYGDRTFALATHRWADGTISPQGFQYLEQFQLDGTLPRWHYVLDDAHLEKQIWMEREANTTYVQYHLRRGTAPLTLSLKVLVNYRDYHSRTTANNWRMRIQPIPQGICVTAFDGATPFYGWVDQGAIAPAHTWYRNVELSAERDRGLYSFDDVLHAATITATLQPGEYLTFIASTDVHLSVDPAASLQRYRDHEKALLNSWQLSSSRISQPSPDWIQQLVLAADQFIVDRPLPNQAPGKTIIAGYHWFADWHRDYQGRYGGDSAHRDRVYHQGTVWGWLLGPFALAHYAAFHDAEAAQHCLQPIAQHLQTAGLGTISEIFDGDPPHNPQGCIAQAWSVAEVLRVWHILETPLYAFVQVDSVQEGGGQCTPPSCTESTCTPL